MVLMAQRVAGPPLESGEGSLEGWGANLVCLLWKVWLLVPQVLLKKGQAGLENLRKKQDANKSNS